MIPSCSCDNQVASPHGVAIRHCNPFKSILRYIVDRFSKSKQWSAISKIASPLIRNAHVLYYICLFCIISKILTTKATYKRCKEGNLNKAKCAAFCDKDIEENRAGYLVGNHTNFDCTHIQRVIQFCKN